MRTQVSTSAGSCGRMPLPTGCRCVTKQGISFWSFPARNTRSLGESVTCDCVLDNLTLFTGIKVLPTRSASLFQNTSLQREPSYFQPREWDDQSPFEAQSYYPEIRKTFPSNLPRYFNANE